jgi:hypothetical protein
MTAMNKTTIPVPLNGDRRLLPRLNVPTQDLSQRPNPYLQPRQLEQWAAELPIGNTTVAAHQLLNQLKSLNSAQYPPQERLKLHNVLRTVTAELLDAMRQSLRQAIIPLDYKNQYNASLLQAILEGMATGYKVAVSELILQTRLKELDNLLLQEAIYLAMTYLGQRLVDAYCLYQPQPRHVWSDINQLYQFAETKNFLQNTIDDACPDTPLPVYPTIDTVYKRTLLLALAEPYHLMQYEAMDIFRLVTASVQSCQIEPFHEIVTQGEFVIDLNADEGPRYITRDMEWSADDARMIDISNVKAQLDNHLQRLLRNNVAMAALDAVSLVERQQRDMLLRLADAWNASLVRKTRRFELDGDIELASGLNACHYFISNSAIFTPEVNELKLSTDKSANKEEARSLFATAYREALQKDRRHGFQQYHLNPWWQRNISPLGVALKLENPAENMDVRVGELVAYRITNRRKRRWQVGVIRWLKQGNEIADGNIDIGIMNLANGGIAVGVKAIKGLGYGTDYFRSLLIPKQTSIQQTRSIIVPALLYDVGTCLVVNMGQRLFHIRLTRVMLSTRSFTQFNFEIIQRPITVRL